MTSDTINLTEAEKDKYVVQFYESFETLLIKKRLKTTAAKTKYHIKDDHSKFKHGVRKFITLTHGKKKLEFTLDVRPWLWGDGTILVEIDFHDARKLNIPKKYVTPKHQSAIYKPGFNPIYFLNNTDAVSNYINAVELSPLDVALFDNIRAAAEHLLSGK